MRDPKKLKTIELNTVLNKVHLFTHLRQSVNGIRAPLGIYIYTMWHIIYIEVYLKVQNALDMHETVSPGYRSYSSLTYSYSSHCGQYINTSTMELIIQALAKLGHSKVSSLLQIRGELASIKGSEV